MRAFQKGVLNKKPSLDNNAFSEAPVETSKSESKSVPEVNRERYPIWVLHDRDDPGDRISITSPPKYPKADLRTHTSPLKSSSPDSTMSNETGSRRDDGLHETVRAEDLDSLFKLNKSNSVVARVSMFAQLEEDMKRAAKEAKTRKFPKASNRSMARREDASQWGNRFATQPVTMGEVEEAVRSARSRDSDSSLAGMWDELVAVWECMLRETCTPGCWLTCLTAPGRLIQTAPEELGTVGMILSPCSNFSY